MEAEPNPKIIEELKAAGEELKKGERKKERKESPGPNKERQPFAIPKVEEKTGWISLENHQKTIAEEKQRMMEAYQKIENLREKVKEKLEIIEETEAQTERINKELKEISQKIVSMKKEDNTLLLQIKDLVGEDNPDQEKNEH